ncbi:MAG: hypothetical protein H6579_10645 [Chitinophagales bacterium]|nr:hypothetical protein [Chitinophagales bacterium]
MATSKNILAVIFILTFFACKKEDLEQEIISVPNGDFEFWDNAPILITWQTNSCPPCLPPYETYIVQKDNDAAHGQFAAKFIYNNFYSSFAINKFAIALHPTHLTGYIKSTIDNGDTALIQIDLFSGNTIMDHGSFYETSSTANYTKIEIPITQNNSIVDSASIRIVGGNKPNTIFFVDNLELIRKNP